MGKKRLHQLGEYAVFVLPVILVLIFIQLIPFINGIRYSFMNWNGISQAKEFVGLDNYAELLSPRGEFWRILWVTLRFVLIIVPTCNIIAILLASLLDSPQLRSRDFARIILFAPGVISMTVTAFLWKYTLSNTFEALAESLGWRWLGVSWLGDPDMAVVSIIIISVWSSVGYLVLIYLAGLQALDTNMLEAAVIDGASPLKQLLYIKLPMIMGVMAVCIFITIADNFRMFELPWLLTRGGPGTSTTTMVVDVYLDGFERRNFGLGAAKSLVLFIIVVAVTLAEVNLTKRKEVQM